MSLILLPPTEFPITAKQCEPLSVNLHQLNIIDAGLDERKQIGIDLAFDIWDLKAKSHGTLDYTGRAGHDELLKAAMAFCGGHSFATRHGDSLAAHLAISYHNARVRMLNAGFGDIPDTVNGLLAECIDLSDLPPQLEKRVDLYLTWMKRVKYP